MSKNIKIGKNIMDKSKFKKFGIKEWVHIYRKYTNDKLIIDFIIPIVKYGSQSVMI